MIEGFGNEGVSSLGGIARGPERTRHDGTQGRAWTATAVKRAYEAV
jgi:hypothetical protein